MSRLLRFTIHIVCFSVLIVGVIPTIHAGTHSVWGKIFEKYEIIGDENGVKGTRSKWGFPISDRYWVEEQGMDCQDFEGGRICEGDWIESCKNGMKRYQNPNDPNDKPCARINEMPYINQYLSKDGIPGHPAIGQYTCGSASTIMTSSGLGSIPISDYDLLKSLVHEDGLYQSLNISHSEERSCNDYAGVFGRTVVSCDYLAHEWQRLRKVLLNTFMLNVSEYSHREGQTHVSFWESVKNVIDEGGVIIQGIGGYNIEHIFIIIGYTDEADKRIIVKDSFRNLMTTDNISDREYSFSGNGAIYTYNYNEWKFGSYLNVTP